jgi:hypothetical protein
LAFRPGADVSHPTRSGPCDLDTKRQTWFTSGWEYDLRRLVSPFLAEPPLDPGLRRIQVGERWLFGTGDRPEPGLQEPHPGLFFVLVGEVHLHCHEQAVREDKLTVVIVTASGNLDWLEV